MKAATLVNNSTATLGVPGSPRRPRIAILSTYAPTACGLATFSAALAAGLSDSGIDVKIVRIVEDASPRRTDVFGELRKGSVSSVAAAAGLLNRCDVAIVQHEYGIYGGPDGDEVVEVMKALRVPSIVIAHTVLKEPSPHQRSVLNAVLARAGRVVVMSEAARSRLCAGFAVDPDKVTTIPHGAALPTAPPATPTDRPTILTWGLLGPGKGIERVIAAMVALQDLAPQPRYLIAGRTHPKVAAAHGEAYREALRAQARRLGVAHAVRFDATYRSPAALTALIQTASLVVLPYDSTEQVTSGVLVDSVASGRPVLATAFPHAVELLGSGAGTVVAHDDPDALSRALRRILTDPHTARAMASEARELAPAMAWPVVAAAYVVLAHELISARASTR